MLLIFWYISGYGLRLARRLRWRPVTAVAHRIDEHITRLKGVTEVQRQDGSQRRLPDRPRDVENRH